MLAVSKSLQLRLASTGVGTPMVPVACAGPETARQITSVERAPDQNERDEARPEERESDLFIGTP
jgi:hypothetical protein